jgi:hypothetical protein
VRSVLGFCKEVQLLSKTVVRQQLEEAEEKEEEEEEEDGVR